MIVSSVGETLIREQGRKAVISVITVLLLQF